MRIVSVLFALLLLGLVGSAQAPAPQVHGNVNEVMRGILYTSSNVIFDAQGQDPEAPDEQSPRGAGPRRSFDGLYGGWDAVATSAIAMAEAANLLIVPGRLCANGRPAPIDQAVWIQGVDGLREVSMAAYRAAQSHDQDAILDVAGQLVEACAVCHDQYRDVQDPANRCMP